MKAVARDPRRARVVFFDWGGVLCGSMTERITNESGLEWTPRRLAILKALNTGRLSLVQAMRRLTLGTPLASRWDEVLRLTLQHLATHRIAPVWSIAGALRRLGLKTAILSNTSIEWACQIRAMYDLGMVFQPSVFSALESVKTGRLLLKPGRAIYRHALALAHAEPSDSLLIDDSEENCAAARALGMNAYHFLDPIALEEELSARFGALPRPPPGCCAPSSQEGGPERAIARGTQSQERGP